MQSLSELLSARGIGTTRTVDAKSLIENSDRILNNSKLDSFTTSYGERFRSNIRGNIRQSVQYAKDVFDSSMGDLVTYTEKSWNESAWDNIGFFANLEKQNLLDDEIDEELKVSDADIKKIRELAEREVINKFTTAEIKVEMTNNNHINSELDLDGIADQLGDLVTEKLEAAAEGVYQ